MERRIEGTVHDPCKNGETPTSGLLLLRDCFFVHPVAALLKIF